MKLYICIISMFGHCHLPSFRMVSVWFLLYLFYLWISVPPIFNTFLCLISKICWTTHQIIVLQWLAKCLACHISKHFQYPLKQLSNAFIWSLFVAYYLLKHWMHKSAWWQVKQKMQGIYPETFFVTQKPPVWIVRPASSLLCWYYISGWLRGITFTPFLSWIPDYIGTSRPLKSKQQRQPPHVHIFFRTEIIQAEALNCSIDRFSCQKEQYKHANRYPHSTFSS